jgi:hypothetical protein
MKKRSVPYLIAALILFAAAPVTPAHSASERDRERITADGEGEAEIQGQELSLARGEALEDALQKAFENALVEILPLELSLTGRQHALDQLATRLRRYLLQYRVLSELPALQVFFVNVEATFSVPLIREDLVSLGIAWEEEGTGEPVELFVRVNGVASVRSYRELIDLFRKMANVKATTPCEVFGTSVVLRLEHERGLEDLVEALSNWRSDEFTFRVEQVDEREISVSLVTIGDPSMDW